MKEALRTAAEREHRSIANMVEVMILDYCGRNGVTIQEQRALLLGTRANRNHPNDKKPIFNMETSVFFSRIHDSASQ